MEQVITPQTMNESLVDEIKDMDAPELLKWGKDKYGARAAIVTSFQDTGCVMIDMMSRVAPGMRVTTIDTLRLPPETYQIMDEIEERYGISIERFQPDPVRLKNMIKRSGEYLFFDSKAKQEYCCAVRKTEPNERILATLDVWFTGLRRDQSDFRFDTPKAQIVVIEGRKIIKIAPMVDWDKARIDNYIEKYRVPRNPLYSQGYTSIGCKICTTPTLPHEDKRAGRWRWFNYLEKDDKECGIHVHVHGSGI